MFVLLTKDLFFVPLIKTAAARLSHEVLTVPNANAPRLAELAVDQVCACIVDLTAVASSDLAETANILRERFPTAQLIAFGPHVHQTQLATAQSSGFGIVLTRGQLNAHIDSYLQAWAT